MLQCHVRACPKWWSTTSAFAFDGTAYLLFSPDDNIVSLHMHLQERQRTNCQDYLVSNQFQYTQLINSTIYWMVIQLLVRSMYTWAPPVSFQQLIKDWTSLLRHRNVFENISGNTEVCMCSPPPHTPNEIHEACILTTFCSALWCDVWNVGLPITEQ